MDLQARQILEKIKMDAIVQLYLQSGSAYLRYIFHNLTTIPNICIGAVLSVSVFSQSSPGWRTVSGALAISSTVLSALTRQIRSGEIGQLHAQATMLWSDFVQKIEIMLSDPNNAEQIWTLIRELRAEYTTILHNQPDPSMWVVSYFNKAFKTVHFVLHPELETIAKRRAHESILHFFRHRDAHPAMNGRLRSSIEQLPTIIRNPSVHPAAVHPLPT